MFFRAKPSWPPYGLLEETKGAGVNEPQANSPHAAIEERARRQLEKLERLYHIGQDNIWDGREVLEGLIAKHGPPRLEPARRDAALRLLSVLLWGELAAWAISADLAERIDDVEAKMAATSQAHDEARHFYVLRDYCRALGAPVPRLGGIARRLLIGILETDSLVEKLVGMQLLVEANALGLFKGLVDAKVEPVLAELLPYYERDEARHVGLGVLYLPRLLRRLGRIETASVIAFQVRCVFFLASDGLALEDDFAALGMNQRAIAKHTVKLQADVVKDMLGALPEPGLRRRDSIRGLLNPNKNDLGAAVVDFLHPDPERETPLWHAATLELWRRGARLADRALA